jgi:hypothetical protein
MARKRSLQDGTVRAEPRDAWPALPDDALLKLRVRDLHVRIEGSWLEPLVARLHAELDSHGLAFRPPCYLADEWFCPDKVPVIGIPFVLAHPRLRQLEQRMMYEVEGGDDVSCMQLLRHECGHALNYAYRLYRRSRWRVVFGCFSSHYGGAYTAHPYSKRFVVHLRDQYAQSHPDEDFAETFAVWLSPDSNWRTRYVGWPALEKLRYVDHLMRTVCTRPPAVTTRETPYAAARMTSTLDAHYERRRRGLKDAFTGYYDEHLARLFASGGESAVPASRVLRRSSRRLVDAVTASTGGRKYDLYDLLGKLARRCDALNLRAPAEDGDATLVNIAIFLTAVTSRAIRPPGGGAPRE